MNKKVSLIIIGLITLTAILFIAISTPITDEEQVKATAVPKPKITPTPKNLPKATEQPVIEIEATTLPTVVPTPTAPPINGSDQHVINDIRQLNSGTALISLLTDEEIIRKIVRAVYGVSEGRIVREHRPIKSPERQFQAQKIGQQTANEQELYHIEQANYERYTHYVSLFSSLNTPMTIELYRYYYPTLEAAYQELGIGKENFHTVLIRAIDILLTTPENQKTPSLIQPTVMYKFSDPTLEKLPPAQKLMLRMGKRNREALKTELKIVKTRLETVFTP